MRHDPLARGLGWLSLALGTPPLVDPRGFSRELGLGDGDQQQAAATLVGVRELLAGALVLRPSPLLLWARVAGDVMDLTLLGRGLAHHDGDRRERTVAATVAVGGIALVDVYAAISRSGRRAEVELTASTTVAVAPEQAYEAWHDFSRLPVFMTHLEQVRVDGTRSHWRATAPFGRTVSWDAETTADEPGRRIAWRSLRGSDVRTTGEVDFTAAPGDRGTEVRVSMTYGVPGGPLGRAVARFFGEEPHQQLDDDLRRFKQVVETGSVTRSEGAPGGKQARGEFPQHAAQPLTRAEIIEVATS